MTGFDFSERCFRSFIDVIDVNTLNLVNSTLISPEDEWHVPQSIIKIENGYTNSFKGEVALAGGVHGHSE